MGPPSRTGRRVPAVAHSESCMVHIAEVRTLKRAICSRSAAASPLRAESIIWSAAFSSRVSRAASSGTLPGAPRGGGSLPGALRGGGTLPVIDPNGFATAAVGLGWAI